MRDEIRDFLANAGWGGGQITPIAGDLSARLYHRIKRGTESAVLMDASALPESLPPFLAMTAWLRKLSLSAPMVLADDPAKGLCLLEDLGDTPVSKMLEDPNARSVALELCLDLLLALRRAAPPALHRPSQGELCDMTRLADQFYPGAEPTGLEAFRSVLETVLTPLCAAPATLSLRDFHADNLIWMADRNGIQQLGLLDYQDAFLTHPVYDLVSLLTDARSDIAPDTRAHFLTRYAVKSGDDPEELHRAFAAFSLQRNLRILGIFHRAAKLDGKTHHLPKLPRVYGYLQEALGHPAFVALRPELERILPPPRVAA